MADTTADLDTNASTSDREAALLARKLDALGPYRLRGIVGSGGMGAVYRAEQTAPVRREVAIKVSRVDLGSAGRLARFQVECQILATLSHPNVAYVHDAGETEEGFPYLVMEYIDGEPIDAYCDGHGLNLRQRVTLLLEVCAAATHAHQHGVIHRDIKPSNILIDTRSGRAVPKLIDFGIAKFVHADFREITDTGHSPGTPAYMSPEQLRGVHDLDTRADVYGLGMTLYRLLVGALPESRAMGASELPRPSRYLLAQADAQALSQRRGGGSAQTLARDLSRELDWIALKATDTDRARRYDSADAMAADLQRYLNGFPVHAAPPSTWQIARKFALRHRLASALALALIVLAGVSLLFLAQSWQRERAALALANAQLRQHEVFNAFMLDLIREVHAAQPSEPLRLADILNRGAALAAERYPDQPGLLLALQAQLAAARVAAGLPTAAPANDDAQAKSTPTP